LAFEEPSTGPYFAVFVSILDDADAAADASAAATRPPRDRQLVEGRYECRL
jgi:hypothetical protein